MFLVLLWKNECFYLTHEFFGDKELFPFLYTRYRVKEDKWKHSRNKYSQKKRVTSISKLKKAIKYTMNNYILNEMCNY